MDRLLPRETVAELRIIGQLQLRSASLGREDPRMASLAALRPSGLVHNDSLIFDGTNYNDWRNRMLDYFRDIDPSIEQILDMGFPPPKDPKRLSLEDEENSYLDAQASNVVFISLRNAVALSVSPYRSAHELWTKLQDKIGRAHV